MTNEHDVNVRLCMMVLLDLKKTGGSGEGIKWVCQYLALLVVHVVTLLQSYSATMKYPYTCVSDGCNGSHAL